jgi:hypothetical protein
MEKAAAKVASVGPRTAISPGVPSVTSRSSGLTSRTSQKALTRFDRRFGATPTGMSSAVAGGSPVSVAPKELR